jgi:hypothetical protein
LTLGVADSWPEGTGEKIESIEDTVSESYKFWGFNFPYIKAEQALAMKNNELDLHKML